MFGRFSLRLGALSFLLISTVSHSSAFGDPGGIGGGLEGREEAGPAHGCGNPGFAGHGGGRFGGAGRLKKMDGDGDGKISLKEFQKARTEQITERFHRFDKDGDGFLTQEELAEARNERQQMRGRGMGGFRGRGGRPFGGPGPREGEPPGEPVGRPR